MTTDRDAIEAALVERPDDFVLHCAYADYLIEQSDTRGEYIRMHLALEDTKQPRPNWSVLRVQANQLLEMHSDEWLGGLAALSKYPTDIQCFWKRGWVDAMRIFAGDSAILTAISQVRTYLLLRSFSLTEIRNSDDELIRSIQELIIRGHFPLLESFTLEIPRGGDDLVRALIESRHLNKLHQLNLCRCDMTDDGAQALAEWPQLRKLDRLDVRYNRISAIGAAELRAACPHVRVDDTLYLG